MFKDYFLLASKNLRKRGLRSWLTILGIFIGIAAVVSLISLGGALRTSITGQFGVLSLDTLTIQNKGTGFGPPGSTVIEKLNEDDVRIIEKVENIEFVVTKLIRISKFEYRGISEFGYVTDIPSNKEKMNFVYDSFNIEMKEGRKLEPGENGKVILGYDFANNFFEEKIRIGKNLMINNKNFEVVGILEKSSSFQLNNVVFILTEDLEELLGINKEYDLIVAKVRDENKIENTAKEIERELREDRNEDIGKESFSVETPLQALDSVNTILNIINTIVIGIAIISLLVGGIGIANTMYTSILERTKEIGIMKAIGARNSDILKIFLIESGLLGLVGGIIGALIGLGAAISISNITNNILGINIFTITISYPLLIGAVLFSFLIGIIFGVFPALQASKLNVVDALRN
jgi:putative ABC transport system permease protein